MNTVKKRFDSLDILKCIAMLMVVSLHTGLWKTDFITHPTISNFMQYCIRIICEGVPIFILVNGFLLIDKEVDLKKHVLKLLKILLLIVFWSIFSFLIINLVTRHETITLKGIIKNTLFLNINNYYCGPLWFLQNLLMLYLIYPILNFVFKNNKKIFYYLFIVVTIFTFVGGIISSISNITSISSIGKINTFIGSISPLKNEIFIFYFMLGAVLYDKYELFKKTKNRIITICLSFGIYIGSIIFTVLLFKFRNVPFTNNYLYGRISLALIIVGIFNLLYAYKNKNRIYNKLIISISSNTLGIYLIHFIIIRILFHFVNVSIFDNLFKRLGIFLLVFVISYLLAFLIKKIPYVNKMIKI